MPVIHIFALHDAPEKSLKLYQVRIRLIYFNLVVLMKYIILGTIIQIFLFPQCPVYKKPQRTYVLFVTPLWLQTLKNIDYWILRGVALLCDNK